MGVWTDWNVEFPKALYHVLGNKKNETAHVRIPYVTYSDFDLRRALEAAPRVFTRWRCKDRYTRLNDHQHPATRLSPVPPPCWAVWYIFIYSKLSRPSVRANVSCLTFSDNWRVSQAAVSEINPRSFSGAQCYRWGRWGSCRRSWDRLRIWKLKSVSPQRRDSRYRNV